MSEETMLSILTGPVGALALCLFAIYFVARWVATHVPIWVDRHLKQIDKMIDSHNNDREMYKETLGTLTVSLKDLGKEVDVIKDDVKEIKQAVKTVTKGQ
jgi:septal ring factor EnvC (AmiA/AmiB activator)